TLLGPRPAHGIHVTMTLDESIASMKVSLLKKLKRSAYVYRVDCGGCNGCEIVIFDTASPLCLRAPTHNMLAGLTGREE
ncbi:hypothetical protein NL499_29100, partial [Klebsiella pneumoniae]|nr:hypothetical protein [Klebsiella pneumoniae]